MKDRPISMNPKHAPKPEPKVSLTDASSVAVECLLQAMDESENEAIIDLRISFKIKFYTALIANTRMTMDAGFHTGDKQLMQLASSQADNLMKRIEAENLSSFIDDEVMDVLKGMGANIDEKQ